MGLLVLCSRVLDVSTVQGPSNVAALLELSVLAPIRCFEASGLEVLPSEYTYDTRTHRTRLAHAYRSRKESTLLYERTNVRTYITLHSAFRGQKVRESEQ